MLKLYKQLGRRNIERIEMDDNYITIDVDALREDLKNDAYGAFFGGAFGGALIEAVDIESASDTEIVEIAREREINLYKYQV